MSAWLECSTTANPAAAAIALADAAPAPAAVSAPDSLLHGVDAAAADVAPSTKDVTAATTAEIPNFFMIFSTLC
jgi:hypothetical protein